MRFVRGLCRHFLTWSVWMFSISLMCFWCAAPIKLAWNHIMPRLFGLASITLADAFCLSIVSSLVLKTTMKYDLSTMWEMKPQEPKP